MSAITFMIIAAMLVTVWVNLSWRLNDVIKAIEDREHDRRRWEPIIEHKNQQIDLHCKAQLDAEQRCQAAERSLRELEGRIDDLVKTKAGA